MKHPKFNAWIPKLEVMLHGVSVYDNGHIGIGYEELEKILKEKNANYSICEGEIMLVDKDEDGDDVWNRKLGVLEGEDWIFFEEKDFELVPWIGVTTNSEVDLYLGDTFQYKSHKGYGFVDFIGEVVWIEECAAYGYKIVSNLNSNDFPFAEIHEPHHDFFDHITVIGNKFEKPKSNERLFEIETLSEDVEFFFPNACQIKGLRIIFNKKNNDSFENEFEYLIIGSKRINTGDIYGYDSPLYNKNVDVAIEVIHISQGEKLILKQSVDKNSIVEKIILY